MRSVKHMRIQNIVYSHVNDNILSIVHVKRVQSPITCAQWRLSPLRQMIERTSPVEKSDALFCPSCLWILTSPFLARMHHPCPPILSSFIDEGPDRGYTQKKLLNFSCL
jgi:hypothetical protein